MSSKNENSKKAFAISILIHGAILFAIASLTVQLTMPEGNVVSTVNFNAIVPEGQQLDTPNVSKVAKTEAPEKIKREAAPPPPPPPDISEDAIKKVETFDDGDMDVVKDMPDYVQHQPAPPEPEPEPVASPAEEAPLPEAPVVGKEAEKTVQAGNDQVDLKGQEKVEDRNFGRAQGVRQADLFLRGVPGNRKPETPWMAKLKNLNNKMVIAVFDVDANGRVSNVRIDKSDDEIYNANVLSAVKGWRFMPPVEPGTYFQPFRFVLKGEAKEAPALLRRKSN